MLQNLQTDVIWQLVQMVSTIMSSHKDEIVSATKAIIGTDLA